LAEDQRAAKERHAHKLALERGLELPKPKQPIKAFDLSKAKPVENEGDETEATEDEESDEENESEQDIEIDERLFVRKEVEPAFARHDKLLADGVEPHEHLSSSFWTNQSTLLVYITMVLCVLAVAAVVLRHRSSRQGFIEVSVK
jgi:hypothetical protein